MKNRRSWASVCPFGGYPSPIFHRMSCRHRQSYVRFARCVAWCCGASLAMGLGGGPVAVAQSCDRLARDCDAEGAAYVTRARAVEGLPPPVRAGLDALVLRRKVACLEWNACALDDAALGRVTTWSDGELQSLARARTRSAKEAWARGLSQRAAARSTVAPEYTPTAAPRPAITPAVVESMMRLKEEAEAYEAFGPLVLRIQRGARLRGHRRPSICESRAHEELRALVRAGSQVVQSDAGSLLRDLEKLCEPFERWSEPNESLRLRLTGFTSHLQRIEGWLTEITRCVDPGPYDYRCENAYGPRDSETMTQAMRALRMLQDVQRIVARAERFPCYSPIWARLATSRWSLRVAEAQLPPLASTANNLCSSIGISEEKLNEAHVRLRDRTESIAARLQTLVTSRRQGLEQLRSIYGEQLPASLR